MLPIRNIWRVYFSPTGTTEKAVTALAGMLSEQLHVPLKSYDFTMPTAREDTPEIEEGDLVVFGTPVYAGRVPNVLLKYLNTFSGNGAFVIPIVMFGNRHYDNALIELRDILSEHDFKVVAAGAFVGEHAFSVTLAKGRPDAEDIDLICHFADKIIGKIEAARDNSLSTLNIPGIPESYGGYYQPKGPNGEKIDIRKVKPLTNDQCTDCKICVHVCPMGSIDFNNVRDYTGICIKCGSCIKKCPEQAKYYVDESFLYHKEDLETTYIRRAAPEIFL